MKNTRTTETEATLVNNLPMMAVSPMIPTVVESETTLPLPEDEKMMAATLAALETGSLTPLIKEELKCSILNRRFVEGKEEIQVDFTVPEKKQQPTLDDEERNIVRREQNRLAAQRFRKKQKDTVTFLLRKTQNLTSENTTLRTELGRIRDERGRLQEVLKNHLLVCPLAQGVNS